MSLYRTRGPDGLITEKLVILIEHFINLCVNMCVCDRGGGGLYFCLFEEKVKKTTKTSPFPRSPQETTPLVLGKSFLYGPGHPLK